MTMSKRSLHQRLQEYCDCYLETDPKTELDLMARYGVSSDVTGDPQEAVLKYLGAAILYGIKENAKKIVLAMASDGKVRFDVTASGRYQMPAPPRDLAERIFETVRAITHLEGERAKERLALGIRNDSVELKVKFRREGETDNLSISFPKL